MTADLTILTPSLPERHDMLVECIASVRAQTVQPARHVVSIDYGRRPIHEHHNALFDGVDTEWVMMLADDDLVDPTYVEVVLAAAEQLGHPAVVWSYCRGGYEGYNQPFSHELLERESCVNGSAIFTTELFDRFSYRNRFRDEWGADWRFWQRLARGSKATFRSVPEVLMTYRWHGANHSFVPREDTAG